jgi:Cytochrome P460
MRISKAMSLAVATTVAAVVIVALVQVNRASSGTGQAVTNVVDAKGNLRVPENYRTLYQPLGTWAIAADSGRGSKELHEVYASPGTIEAFRRGGRFPDGAVLVKEVLGTSTMGMTTGTVSHAAALKGWFVMVKDSRNSHPGNPLWGDGWGWSWFDAGQPLRTTSTNYKTDCQGCHVPAQSTDWIYVSGYPVLHR